MIWVQLVLGVIAAAATIIAAYYAREAAKVGGAAVDAAHTTTDLGFFLEPERGLEPLTPSLPWRCSAD